MSLLKKYKPKDLNDIIQHQELVKRLLNVVKKGNLKNMILVGSSGIGKTEIIHNLIYQIFQNNKEAILELNTTDERGINVVRDKIKMFSQKKVNLIKGQTKIVILDEADTLTQGAQQALRRMIELYSNTTRFIFICNSINNIIEPIQSRCCIYNLSKISNQNILNKLIDICNKEGINYQLEGLNKIVLISNGDLRQAIQNLDTVYVGFNYINIENIDKICDVTLINNLTEIIDNIYHKIEYSIILQKLYNLLDLGYSFQDILEYLFILLKENTKIKDIDKLKMIKELSLIDIRIIQGIQTKLQLNNLLYHLYYI